MLPLFGRTWFRQLSTSAQRLGHLESKEVSPYVFHVRMNRPEKRNTLTQSFWKEFEAVFGELSDNPKCRAIVLSGEGKSFCAGIDLQEGLGELMGMMDNDKLDAARKGRKIGQLVHNFQKYVTSMESCVKPVIAAIHSHCIGAGIDMITACDVRFASKDSVFSIKEVAVGLAADVGTLARIQKVVGNDSLTRELAFSARDFGAEEALKYGLVSRVLENQEEVVAAALKLAETIAEMSPVAVQGTKVVLNHARNHTIDESLEFVRIWNQSQLNTEDLMKSGMAMMTKQKAEFIEV